MESRFGQDFSWVRIHDDTTAHRAASALDARAFTLEEHIAFGAGQYAPGTRSGRSLLAHELTHVLQQNQQSFPVVRRAPVLSKRTPGELVSDDQAIAKDIDAAVAASPTITTYIPAKKLKKASGHLHIEFKETFEKHLADQAKALHDTSQPESGTVVKGFTDLAAGEIHLKERLANVEGALHETVHLNSKPGRNPAVSSFQGDFGHPMEEGVTQFFTNKVLDEQGLSAGSAYPKQLEMAEGLVSVVGENLVGKAYFNGEHGARDAVLAAFNRTRGSNYTAWHKSTRSDDEKDWAASTKQLKAAFGQ